MLLFYKVTAALLLLALTFVLLRKLWLHYYRPQIPADSIFPDSRFAEIDGFNIRYVQRGGRTKPDLILLHGIGASIYSWRLIIDDLAKNYRVTAIDLPGFGLSDKHPDQSYGLDEQTSRVMSLLEHLNIKKFSLIGHSMGGGISAWIGKVHASQVSKLALITPAIQHKFVKFKPGSWLWGIHLIKKMAVTPAVVKRLYTHICYRHSPSNMTEVVQNYFRPYNKNPNAVVTFFKSLELVRDPRLSTEVHGLSCPTFILYCDRDPVVPRKAIEKYLKANPQVNSHLILDCGHMPAEEKPPIVLAQLHKFFDDQQK